MNLQLCSVASMTAALGRWAQVDSAKSVHAYSQPSLKQLADMGIVAISQYARLLEIIGEQVFWPEHCGAGFCGAGRS